MIVSLQVTSAPICPYRLAHLLACGQGGVGGLPGEAGAAPAERMGKLGAIAMRDWARMRSNLKRHSFN